MAQKTMFTAKIVADQESESGASIVFPDHLMEDLGWKEGDKIEMEVNEKGEMVITKVE